MCQNAQVAGPDAGNNYTFSSPGADFVADDLNTCRWHIVEVETGDTLTTRSALPGVNCKDFQVQRQLEDSIVYRAVFSLFSGGNEICSQSFEITGGSAPGGGTPGTGGGGIWPSLESCPAPITGPGLVIPNPLRACTLVQFISFLIDWLVIISIPIALSVLIIAGALWTTAAGNPERVKLGRMALIYAVVGLTLILIAKGVVDIIKTFLGTAG
jgi:hypothetical protein